MSADLMRIGSVIYLGLVGLLGCQVSTIAGNECMLQRIPVKSTDPLRNEVYVARAKGIEVRFRNENAPTPAEVFPDSLVTVRNLKTAQSCEVKNGSGIWSGQSVYLDANERLLILNAYSGASDTLVFSNPKTCQGLAEVDVSNKRWEISGNSIRTGERFRGDHVDSCRSIRVLRLDESCSVKADSSS